MGFRRKVSAVEQTAEILGQEEKTMHCKHGETFQTLGSLCVLCVAINTERERCAKICEDQRDIEDGNLQRGERTDPRVVADVIAARIREGR